MKTKETCSTLLKRYLDNEVNIYNVEKIEFDNVGEKMFTIYQLLFQIRKKQLLLEE